MKLRILLLTSLLGIGCLHAMEKEVIPKEIPKQKEVILTKDTKKQIDRFVLNDDLIEMQKLLKGIPSTAHEYALEQAVIYNKFARKIIDWLIDIKTNVNTTYAGGNTPLHIAAEYDNVDLVDLLLKNKANINAQNNRKKTPLDIAIAFHNDKVAQLLKQAMLDQEARSVPVTPRPGYKIVPRGLKK